jgi:hypothetical protein
VSPAYNKEIRNVKRKKILNKGDKNEKNTHDFFHRNLFGSDDIPVWRG